AACCEDSFLERICTAQRSLSSVDLIVEVGVKLIFVESFVLEVFSFGASSEGVLDPVCQAFESPESLRHQNACREAGCSSDRDQDRSARRRFFLFFFAKYVRRLVMKAEGRHRCANLWRRVSANDTLTGSKRKAIRSTRIHPPKMLTLRLPDGAIREVPEGALPRDLVASIGPRLLRDAIAVKVDGEVQEL